jgi:soluble lytic murein transglycosylase-like protein
MRELTVLSAVLAIVLVTVGSGSSVQTAFAGQSPAEHRAVGQPRTIQLLDLPSIDRLFTASARQLRSKDEGVRVAAWADFSLLVAAIVDDRGASALAIAALAGPTTMARAPGVVGTPAMSSRDRVAYHLLALGYSARETADIISGRIGKQALDTAHKMLLVGRGQEAAANYLDSQYRRAPATKIPLLVPPGERRIASASSFDAAIERYAARHKIDAVVVRAIIAVESAFDPRARSRAGAVGLMQLMPATARALGVDPFMPEQNIEGGVRYLSELLKMFGGIELGLVAYNGGPGFARRYARGETALYGETRAYVKNVMALIRAPR